MKNEFNCSREFEKTPFLFIAYVLFVKKEKCLIKEQRALGGQNQSHNTTHCIPSVPFRYLRVWQIEKRTIEKNKWNFISNHFCHV